MQLVPGDDLPFDPFDGRPLRLRVAARPLDPAEWIVLDDRTPAELAEKDALLADPATRAACVADDGSRFAREAAVELLDAVETHLAHHHRDHLAARTAELPADLAPLDRAGRLVPEDWCLLDPPVLVGATLCFPNRWVLAEKLGRPLSEIHGPVPGFAERIGRATDLAVARVEPDQPITRWNWSIHDDARLHQPGHHHVPAAGLALTRGDGGAGTGAGTGAGSEAGSGAGSRAEVGALVVLRLERQTLVRLPRTRAVVFGIRTLVRTLDEVLAADPTVAGRLAVALETMPDDLRAYKSLERLGPVVSAWLRARADS